MGISRVQKYKEYRNSMIKDGSPTLETPEKTNIKEDNHSTKNTTSTLPMDQVIESLNSETNQEDLFIKKEKRKRTIKLVLIVSALVAVAIGIVIFGILVWSK